MSHESVGPSTRAHRCHLSNRCDHRWPTLFIVEVSSHLFWLPTVRKLAADMGLAANTVAKAYRQLELAGLIETRGRNGTFVAGEPSAKRALAVRAAQEFARRMHELGIGNAEAIAILREEVDLRWSPPMCRTRNERRSFVCQLCWLRIGALFSLRTERAHQTGGGIQYRNRGSVSRPLRIAGSRFCSTSESRTGSDSPPSPPLISEEQLKVAVSSASSAVLGRRRPWPHRRSGRPGKPKRLRAFRHRLAVLRLVTGSPTDARGAPRWPSGQEVSRRPRTRSAHRLETRVLLQPRCQRVRQLASLRPPIRAPRARRPSRGTGLIPSRRDRSRSLRRGRRFPFW